MKVRLRCEVRGCAKGSVHEVARTSVYREPRYDSYYGYDQSCEFPPLTKTLYTLKNGLQVYSHEVEEVPDMTNKYKLKQPTIDAIHWLVSNGSGLGDTGAVVNFALARTPEVIVKHGVISVCGISVNVGDWLCFAAGCFFKLTNAEFNSQYEAA